MNGPFNAVFFPPRFSCLQEVLPSTLRHTKALGRGLACFQGGTGLLAALQSKSRGNRPRRKSEAAVISAQGRRHIAIYSEWYKTL